MVDVEHKQWTFDKHKTALVAMFNLAPDATVALNYDPDIVLSRAGTIKQERLAGQDSPAKRVYEALTNKGGV